MGEHLEANLDRLEKAESTRVSLMGQGAEVVSMLAKISKASSSSREAEYKEKDKVIMDVDQENETANEKAPLIGMAVCRICQEEDSLQDLESHCACNGSLKYAHRKCVQHWCNGKGNITCEICPQKTNPVVDEIFSIMFRDEARHARFLNKGLSDFNLAIDLGFNIHASQD